MTMPGMMGAAAVFGGSEGGQVDFSNGMLDQIRKRKMLEQAAGAAQNPIGMGRDPAQMMGNPMADQARQAGMMQSIRPTAQNPMIQQPPAQQQAQANPMMNGPHVQGVGAGPNPIGALPPGLIPPLAPPTNNAVAAPLGTPPPPPPMQSPLQRAISEVPKPPEDRGFGGALKEGFSSMIHGQGAIRGLSGDYAKDEYKKKLAEKAGIYGEQEAFNRQQEGDQMKKNEFNLKVREQGSREQLGEDRINVLEQNLERQRLASEAQREDFHQRAAATEQERIRDHAEWEKKFEQQKLQFEQQMGQNMSKNEEARAHQLFQEQMQQAQMGISAGHLGLANREFEDRQRQDQIVGNPKDGFFRYNKRTGKMIPIDPYGEQNQQQQQGPNSPFFSQGLKF